ncbi:MAG: alpha/beta fold hydrolase [Lentisphaeria bacterium]|nr:alpha/beta fold hydrolase [Lentisphaeria bacterium]
MTDHTYLGETLTVPTADGETLRVTVAYRDDTDVNRLVMIFPPNPILGGDSQNNVVQALLEEAAARGALAVTFDYRGVADGRVGQVDMMTYWENLNETGDFSDILTDVTTVAAAVKKAFGSTGCQALIGYSFGCLIAVQSATALGCSTVAGISPPIGEYDFTPFLDGLDLTVFVAPEDLFCPAEEAKDVFGGYGCPIVDIPSDDHFFRDTEPLLAQQVFDSLMPEMSSYHSPRFSDNTRKNRE